MESVIDHARADRDAEVFRSRVEGAESLSAIGRKHDLTIASVDFDDTAALADLALDGIVDVLVSDAEPNAVAINPVTWASLLKPKASGSGEYLNIDSPFGQTADVLWNLPVVKSRAVPLGQALVGDWTQGATLFIREAANLRVSDSDQDDFVKNRATFLAEGRFAVAIWRPGCFALVNLQ